MAKKSFGKMMVFAAITGAAIGAGLYYLKKYKSFNEELEEEFLDVEGDDEEDSLSEETKETGEEEEHTEGEPKDGEMETVEAAEIESSEESKRMPEENSEPAKEDSETDQEGSDASDAKRKYIPLNVNTDKLKAAAKDTGEKAIDALKDGASILSGFVHEAAPVVKDKMHTLKAKASEKIESYKHAKDSEGSEPDEPDFDSEDDELSVSLEETEGMEETVSDDSAVPEQETDKKSAEEENDLKQPEETAETESTIKVEEDPKE